MSRRADETFRVRDKTRYVPPPSLPPCVRTHARRMLHPMHRYPLPWWLILDAQILRSATQFLRRNVTSFAIAVLGRRLLTPSRTTTRRSPRSLGSI